MGLKVPKQGGLERLQAHRGPNILLHQQGQRKASNACSGASNSCSLDTTENLDLDTKRGIQEAAVLEKKIRSAWIDEARAGFTDAEVEDIHQKCSWPHGVVKMCSAQSTEKWGAL
ncbi:hypothetical protein NDU88_000521, partial [Pleurodeles waltl]